MPYRVIPTSPYKRSRKKLPPAVVQHIKEKAHVLVDDPFAGKPLKGKYHRLHSLHMRYRKTDYRLIYNVNHKAHEIYVIYVGSRENIYAALRHLGIGA